MPSLKQRLEELMRHMGWDRRALTAASCQSSSVVSQWLGHGSKEIKSIGKMEAAEALERATGFSALWIAKGLGPKRTTGAVYPLPTVGPQQVITAAPTSTWKGDLVPEEVLIQMGALLSRVPHPLRGAVGDLLLGWAVSGGSDDRREALLLLLRPSGKQRRQGA